MIQKASSFFAASMLMAYTQASKLVISQTAADNLDPECCRFYTGADFSGDSFDLCMEKVFDPINPMLVDDYKQASRALTDDATFDDGINSVQCGRSLVET